MAPARTAPAPSAPRVEAPGLLDDHRRDVLPEHAARPPTSSPAAYRGGIFLAVHGSWHCCPATPPRVIYVPFTGDTPAATAVNWSAPTAQWQPFLSGFGSSAKASYTGRPTGIAVGAQGSLFVGDDAKGVIYRIRPN